MRKPPRRPKRYHHGDLPRALLDAALHIVETQGTGALTLRAAARSAGVSQAAPYRHFTNKEAILAAVAEEGFRSLMTAIRQATAAGDGPLGRLRPVNGCPGPGDIAECLGPGKAYRARTVEKSQHIYRPGRAASTIAIALPTTTSMARAEVSRIWASGAGLRCAGFPSCHPP